MPEIIMIRKCRRLLPSLLGLFTFLIVLRIFCVIPCNSPTEKKTKEVPAPSDVHQQNTSKDGTKVIIKPAAAKPATPKPVPKHDHEQGPKYDPNKMNPFSLFSHFPLDIDVAKVVAARKSGQEVDVKPVNTHEYNYLIIDKKKCKNSKKIFLAILVKTRPDSFERRSVLRRTWGNETAYQNFEVRTLFLIGYTANRSIQESLFNEQKKHGDLLQEDFVDSYLNNTKKLVMGLKWAVTHCRNAKYVMFADDDMMILPNNIVPLLLTKQVMKMQRLYMGYLPLHPQPYRGPGKWHISVQDYPFPRFPDYATTGALFLNLDCAHDIYLGFHYTRMINFDDVYVGMVAQKLGIKAIHNDFVYPDRKNYDPKVYETLIATHGAFKSQELLDIWQAYQTDLKKRS